jgi:hypothetical protein
MVIEYNEIPSLIDDLLSAISDLDDLCGANIESLSEWDLGEGVNRYEPRFTRMEELVRCHRICLRVKEEISESKDKLDWAMGALGVQEDANLNRHDGRRVINVVLSKSMIGSGMLTMTQAKRAGIVSADETLKIAFPNGEVAKAQIAEPNNRLTIRKLFKELYEKESLQVGDVITLEEQENEEGLWDLSVRKKVRGEDIDF